MNATLLENPVQTVCPSRREVELTALVEKLLGEVSQLRGEVAELRRQAGYRRTCDCPNVSQTLIAPAPAKLIPKGRYGISVWVHLLLAKFASHRALGNAIEALSHYDLDLPQGTITDGLKRISPLLEPVYEAILARNAESFYRQADETRWR